MRAIFLTGLALWCALVFPGTAATAAPVSKAKATPKFNPHDLTGIWMQTRARPFPSYPFNDQYQAIFQQRLADEAAERPFQVAQDRCLPAGLAASMTTGAYPIEIYYQTGGQEILLQ